MAKSTTASVRQKLLNKSREEKRPFQELLQYYAMERDIELNSVTTLYEACKPEIFQPHDNQRIAASGRKWVA